MTIAIYVIHSREDDTLKVIAPKGVAVEFIDVGNPDIASFRTRGLPTPQEYAAIIEQYGTAEWSRSNLEVHEP